MKRIKVTGYINVEDMAPEDVDVNHQMGVSDGFHFEVTTGTRELPPLNDLDFELFED